MTAFIALLHIAGWGTLIAIVVPQHFSVGSTVFGIGIGLTAYMLGVRHAFDADHIAAIDNTTRKLIGRGRRPASVGFWFSLGHSSVVFMLTLLLAFGIRAVAGPVLDDGSLLHGIAGLIGTVVSSGFLYAIAALNIVVLVDVWKAFRRMRTGHWDEVALENQLGSRGMMNRLLGRVMNVVTEPWQMYVVGLLFGLGFDTATEIALLVLTGSGAASGLPWYAVLCLPVLFAAGMSLFDTLDGSFMTIAYGWALAKPARKFYYNLVITGLSVAVALLIGTAEVIGLIAERLNLQGPFWRWVAAIDLNRIGFVIVGFFVATWMVAIAIWKYGRLEKRWTPAFRPAAVESDQGDAAIVAVARRDG
jgi:nickel/cobalt transporter (NiCoT) family protein